MSFSLPKQSQNLDLSYRTDLDFWDCFGREKTYLITEEIWYIVITTESISGDPCLPRLSFC